MSNNSDQVYTKPTITEVGSMSEHVNDTFNGTVSDGMIIILPGGGMVIQTISGT